MKKLYEIEWPDSHGPEWLNEDNVQLVFNDYCPKAGVVVREIKKKRLNIGISEYKEINMNNTQREMTLEEWCSKLPDFHLVNKQLKELLSNHDTTVGCRRINDPTGGA